MPRAKTMEQLEVQLAALKEREKAIKQQQRQLRRREAAAERKQRNHALMTIGALFEKEYAGGDWTRIDWQGMAAYMARFGSSAPARDFVGDPRSAADATAELREFEAREREAGRAGREMVAKALADAEAGARSKGARPWC